MLSLFGDKLLSDGSNAEHVVESMFSPTNGIERCITRHAGSGWRRPELDRSTLSCLGAWAAVEKAKLRSDCTMSFRILARRVASLTNVAMHAILQTMSVLVNLATNCLL